MIVGELIKQLGKFNPDAKMVFYCEDDTFITGNALFEIDTIRQGDATTIRGEDGIPRIRFGKSPDSEQFVIIEITKDF